MKYCVYADVQTDEEPTTRTIQTMVEAQNVIQNTSTGEAQNVW